MASILIERGLYAGKHHVVHNPLARGSQPRYVVTTDGIPTKPKGVTTIQGAVLAKDLGGWMLDCMATELIEKIPVITKEDIEEAKKASSKKRDSGANTGTEAHALVEQFLKGEEVQFSGVSEEARKAYAAFIEWFGKAKPEVINVEEVIYSEKYDFAGTYDCMLRIDGKVYLCDLKTTNASRKAPNGVYAENFTQLGAYALAHEEQRIYEETNGGTELVKIEGLMVISAKKTGKLDIVTSEDLALSVDDCSSMFKRIVDLFRFMNYTTKELGGK